MLNKLSDEYFIGIIDEIFNRPVVLAYFTPFIEKIAGEYMIREGIAGEQKDIKTLVEKV